jgi:hypothetical protein
MFNIGTILKTNLSRRYPACGESPVKKSIAPSIINEALLSPGCTRADKNTSFFPVRGSASPVFFGLVIVSIGHLFPAMVYHRVFDFKKEAFTGSFLSLVR